ncbi:hypothetical protein Dimus_030988 [Dionaea muscipula]
MEPEAKTPRSRSHEDDEHGCSQLDHQRGLRSNNNNNNKKSRSAVEEARKLLARRMLVGVDDGRFFLGNFYCIDKQGNIILQDTVEFRSVRRSSPSPSPSPMEQRGLGLILIPASCRTSCHIDDPAIEDQLSTLSV